MSRLTAAVFPWFIASLLAQDDLTFEPLAEIGNAYRVSAALGDVDGDGVEDLVIGRNGAFAIRRGVAAGPVRRLATEERALSGTVALSCENSGQPRLVDLDDDGDLDLLTLDSPLGSRDQVVWFANGGRGEFGHARPLDIANGTQLDWVLSKRASAVDVVDWDRDGRLDVIVATPQVVLHRGTPDGFLAQSTPLGPMTRGMAVLDWDGDDRLDVLGVDGDRLVVHLGTPEGLADPLFVTRVEGDPGQVRIAAADWNAEGRPDVLLCENLTLPPPDGDAELAAMRASRLAAAERVLAVIEEEIRTLDAEAPPRNDLAALARRVEWREQLHRWAAGPRTLRDELRAAHRPRLVGTVRLLLR